MAGAPFPLPSGASVPCRGQCRVVLCGGEGGRGWGACCGVSPARPGAGGHPSALRGEAGEPRGPHVAPQLPVWGGAQGPGPPGVCTPSRAAGAGRGGRGTEANLDPRGHLWVTWGVYLCAGKPPLADIILSHLADLTRCDSVISWAIPAMSGHIQYRGAASGDLYIGISGINRVFLS